MRRILLLGVFALLLAGCTMPNPEPINQTTEPTGSPPNVCNNETCFIAAANNCEAMNLTLTDDVGAFAYSSTRACVFTKTLVSLDANESQEMKDLLEGKNMTCIYEKGNFDSRLVTTMLGGMEYCDGELKDNLARLAVFS